MAQSQKLVHHPRGRVVPKKRSRMPLLVSLVACVAVIVGVIVVSIMAQPTVTVAPFTPRTINAPTGITPEGYAYKGSPDAPVTVVEYGDFQCPSCANFATQFESQLDQQYIETGKVRFIYHDFPLAQHNHAVIAAAAARAAGEQGKFWAMHDLLFARQRSWSQARDVMPLLRGYADALGLDREAFEQALDSEKYVSAILAAQRAGEQRGVQATPTFEVDGQLVSAPELQMAIEAALQVKGK